MFEVPRPPSALNPQIQPEVEAVILRAMAKDSGRTVPDDARVRRGAVAAGRPGHGGGGRQRRVLVADRPADASDATWPRGQRFVAAVAAGPRTGTDADDGCPVDRRRTGRRSCRDVGADDVALDGLGPHGPSRRHPRDGPARHARDRVGGKCRWHNRTPRRAAPGRRSSVPNTRTRPQRRCRSGNVGLIVVAVAAVLLVGGLLLVFARGSGRPARQRPGRTGDAATVRCGRAHGLAGFAHDATTGDTTRVGRDAGRVRGLRSGGRGGRSRRDRRRGQERHGRGRHGSVARRRNLRGHLHDRQAARAPVVARRGRGADAPRR